MPPTAAVSTAPVVSSTVAQIPAAQIAPISAVPATSPAASTPNSAAGASTSTAPQIPANPANGLDDFGKSQQSGQVLAQYRCPTTGGIVRTWVKPGP